MSYFTPYRHPTTVVLIDDNVRFMENLSFGLHALPVSFKMFASAKEALLWLNALNPPLTCSQENDVEESALPSLDTYRFNLSRFDEPAIVVVDYDMPEMTGLEFCQAIASKKIKKIMLTGVADEKVALDAFNNDIIDRFIMKQEDKVLERLKESIDTLQRGYFREKAACLPQNKALPSYLPFMNEPAFATIFEAAYAQGGYVEYYVNIAPDGIWMIRENGEADFFAIQSDESFADQLVIAQDREGPDALLEALTGGDIVTCFEHGFYEQDCQDWQAALHQAAIFEGEKQRYRYARINNPFPHKQAELVSFNRYQELQEQML